MEILFQFDNVSWLCEQFSTKSVIFTLFSMQPYSQTKKSKILLFLDMLQQDNETVLRNTNKK